MKVGPVHPAQKSLDLGPSRYHTFHFTLPKPQYTVPTSTFDRISNVLLESSPQDLKALDDAASARLPDMKRPNRGGGIGFFNQGVVTGGVLLATAVISSAGGVAYCIYKFSWPVAWLRGNIF